MALKKPEPQGGGPSVSPLPGGVSESALPVLFPVLWEYLSGGQWEDGSRRETSTVTIFVEDGQVKLCLNDRELKRTTWSTGLTLEAAAEGLESRLRDDRAEWRGSKPGGRRGR